MKCPFCDHEDLKVTDSRNQSDSNAIRRRRECLKCERRFTTFEMVEIALQVHKRDGRYEDFQQHKLINGLAAACRHTRISPDQVQDLSSKIVTEVIDLQVREISTQRLGEMVMAHLKKLDDIAYIRFACVYKRFKDIDELVQAIATLNAKDVIQNKSQ
jgi:transcriptional repressor NrdR